MPCGSFSSHGIIFLIYCCKILYTSLQSSETFDQLIGAKGETADMANEATLYVKMDADIKERAELLYRRMGTSLAEGVRIFTVQSLEENGIPFSVHVPSKKNGVRIGAAEGMFKTPENIDADNDEIAELFGGK